MRLYFCRVRREPEKMVARLLITREGYTIADSPDDVQYSTDLEGMQEVAHKYPELEVCCLDANPVAVPTGPVDSGMQISGVSLLDILLASKKFQDAMKDLQAIRPTMFCELDDNSALSVLSDTGITYDHNDDRIYINLEYPRLKRDGIPRMSLGG